MPCCQAASTVAAASASGMLRNMLPNGAEPKPSGPLISLSLMLMISPRVRSRDLGQPPSLPHPYQAFRLDTPSVRRPVVPGQTVGIPQVETSQDLRVTRHCRPEFRSPWRSTTCEMKCVCSARRASVTSTNGTYVLVGDLMSRDGIEQFPAQAQAARGAISLTRQR